jgi:hypothetical protein
MLLKNEVTQASDVELLAAVIGNRGTAEKLLMQAGGPSSISCTRFRRRTETASARNAQALTQPTRSGSYKQRGNSPRGRSANSYNAATRSAALRQSVTFSSIACLGTARGVRRNSAGCSEQGAVSGAYVSRHAYTNDCLPA